MMEQEIRAEMMKVCRWLSERTFVAADAGAVSARISPSQILITPRGQSLNWLVPEQLVPIDAIGHSAAEAIEPSPTLPLHLAVYRQRTDIQAVVLAQPPSATAFALSGIPLVHPALAETVLTLGSVPITGYATPYTEEAAASIGHAIQNHDALLLKHRGLLTVGLNLMDALQKLERVEQLATVLLAARSLDHIDLLPGAQVKKLMDLRARMKLGGKNPWSQPRPENGE